MTPEDKTTDFHNLNPDIVIDLAESCMQEPFTGICRPLNSYINRVYELEARGGNGIIIKFYRPGRWNRRSLQDEHDFLLELADRDVPVIPPLDVEGGGTLGEFHDISYALFPKKGGRFISEYSEEQWLELGRLLARTHAVGALKLPHDRITIHPQHSTMEQIKFLKDGDFLPEELANDFFEIAGKIIGEISPLFEKSEMIRIHGDCHFSNIIYRPDESFYLIDFDDFSIGPPIQDLWMLLPDHPEKSLYEIDLFMEGYETFRPFDRRSLHLIEPLRAMRYIHYISWCAHQAKDGGIPPIPDWGSVSYWVAEVNDLRDQLDRIRESLDSQLMF